MPLLLAGFGLLLLPGRSLEAVDASPCVAVILDCSHSMATEMATDARTDVVAALGRRASGSRMDVAKDVLKTQFDELASSGSSRVALWLFGHRLAWETDVQEPNLLEQTEYLEQSLGFNILSELLPGDDVELARPMIKLEPESLQPLYMKLGVVKPWGEEPLYLALVRSLDNFGRQVASADRRIIVITDGANQQGLSKFLTTKAQVLEAVDRRPVAVHIIRLGDEEISRQSEAELKQIATHSHGSYARALTANELTEKLAEALDEAADPKETTPSPTSTVSTGAPEKPEAPKFQTVEGTVSLYKRTVRGAKVVLEADGDQRQTFTDGDGKYEFKSVPEGSYTLRCEATVKNIIRDRSQPIRVVPVANESLNVPISLEDGVPYRGPAYQDG
jgi:hypothetical protein